MIDRATSAYRTDARRRPDPDQDDEDEERDRRSDDGRTLADIRAPSIKARDAMIRRLTGAWRTPSYPPRVKRDAAEPTLPAPRAAPAPRRPVPDDDPQVIRERAYADYAASISEAWKTGPGGRADPARAAAIEREREVVTNERS